MEVQEVPYAKTPTELLLEADPASSENQSVFAVENVRNEVERLKGAGVKVRPDLDKAEWGLENLFEDGCGNLLMLQGP